MAGSKSATVYWRGN